jgi:hypothetical protein
MIPMNYQGFYDDSINDVLYEPQYVWKRAEMLSVCKNFLFRFQGVNGFIYEWIISYSCAHAVRANIRKTNESRFTHSPIKSYPLLNLALFCRFMLSLCCSLLACEEAARQVSNPWMKERNEARHDFSCMQRRNDCGKACCMLHAERQETQGNMWVQRNNPWNKLNQTGLRLFIELNHWYQNNRWCMRCFMAYSKFHTVITRIQ